MNCDEVARYVDAYVDGEFEQRERTELEQHLRDCSTCNDVVRSERAFRRRLKDKLPPVAAPPHLRARIVEQLDAMAEGSSEGTGKVVRLAARYAPLALAAGLLLVLAWPLARPGDDAPPEVEAVALGGMSSAGASRLRADLPQPGAFSYASLQGLKADVRGDEPDIRRYMSSRLPFSVSVPFQAGNGVELLGARQITAEGRPAVMFIFSVDDERVNVIQMAATRLEATSPDVRIERRGTATWGQWVQNGLRNTLVSELDPSRVSDLLRTALISR